MRRKKLVLTSEIIRVLGSELTKAIGGEPVVNTRSFGFCTLSFGFSYCYSVCINGSGCNVE
jgi:hypothetical protein